MGVELDHDDVATQLVYLVAGVERETTKYQVTQRLLGKSEDHAILAGGGHTGMVADMLPYAKLISSYLASLAEQDFPGVYEYQVTECLGIWLAKAAEEQNGGIFPVPAMAAQFKEQLLKLSIEFFKGN